MYLLKISALIALTVLLAGTGCTGSGSTLADPPGALPQNPVQDDPEMPSVSLPIALPQDALQPWETLSPEGYAVAARQSSGINLQSNFTRGNAYFDTGGTFLETGQTLDLISGTPGDGELSYAVYRLPLAGLQPGVISVDAALHLRGDGSQSSYWIGLSDYTADSWDWHGPFGDSHARVSTGADVRGGTSYISPLGNSFVAVAVFDGSNITIVGLGDNPFDIADIAAPPAPAGLNAVPRAGGLELTWNGVLDDDLAGYRIYHRSGAFGDPHTTGVVALDGLEGAHRYLLTGLTGETYVRVSAVDISGNESPLSNAASGVPLGGTVPVVTLVVHQYDTLMNAALAVQADGADSYDFDLDGDGAFEIAGTTETWQLVDTSVPGIIRPAVRGSSSGGEAVALAAVSVLVTQNIPPVAVFSADRYHAYLDAESTQFHFDASESYDPEGDTLDYYFDPQGDGIFAHTGLDSVFYTYTAPGVYQARLRVVDDQGQADYDSLLIKIYGFGVYTVGRLTFHGGHYTLTEYNNRPAMAWYDSTQQNLWFCLADNATGTSWRPPLEICWSPVPAGEYCSIAVVDGLPAVAFYGGGSGAMMYIRAEHPECDNGQWMSAISIDTSAISGMYSKLAVVNGNPAVCYRSTATDNLMYLRATSTTGAVLGDWGAPVTADSTPGTGAYCSLNVVGGNPAIAYVHLVERDVYYVRAEDANGDSWGTPVMLWDDDHNYIRSCDLEIVAGNPAICFCSSYDGIIYFVRAEDAAGSTWGPVQAVHVDTVNNSMYTTTMEVVDGRPAIAYYNWDLYTINYMWAVDALGASWYDPIVVESYDTNDGLELAVINGKPMIAIQGTSDTAEIVVPVLE